MYQREGESKYNESGWDEGPQTAAALAPDSGGARRNAKQERVNLKCKEWLD